MADPEKSGPPKKIWAELRGAGLPVIAGVAVGLVIAYAGALWLSGRDIETLGQVGDSFGALTSLLNALAFAAVVATVVLQSRELKESRQELAKQSEAQKAWADAAARQIELTKQLEAVRIRPFIKAEWHPAGSAPPTYSYRVKNVGLGVGVLRRLDLRARGQDFGSVDAHGDAAAGTAWTECMVHAVGEGVAIFKTAPSQFDDLNRALAPGEWQAVVAVSFRSNVAEAGLERLREHFRPVIHFQSGDGEEFSTSNQFDSLKTFAAQPTATSHVSPAAGSSMRWNPDLLDSLIAPGISKFTHAEILDLRHKHAEGAHWLANHFLSNVFRASFAAPYKHYVVNLIYRIQTAFREYHEARELTLRYLDGHEPSQPRVTSYFLALSKWEYVFLNLAIVIDLLRKFTDSEVFAPGDASPERRLHSIAGDIRHCGGRIRGRVLGANDTVPAWLTNEGFVSVSGHKLTFGELAKIIDDSAGIANDLQDADTFRKRLGAQSDQKPDEVGGAE